MLDTELTFRMRYLSAWLLSAAVVKGYDGVDTGAKLLCCLRVVVEGKGWMVPVRVEGL